VKLGKEGQPGTVKTPVVSGGSAKKTGRFKIPISQSSVFATGEGRARVGLRTMPWGTASIRKKWVLTGGEHGWTIG